MENTNITIIGAGVVGLALAAELSQEHSDIVVLEKNESYGQETSSRNSEVIHSGIYYETGSLKAKLCVEGAELLYNYCDRNTIPYKKIGKLIVARDENEYKKLLQLLSRGKANHVKDPLLWDVKELHQLEPNVIGVSAIYLKNTGIIDSHTFMKTLYQQAKANGVLFSFHSEVDSIQRKKNNYRIGIKNDNYQFHSKIVINSAGLNSDNMAKLIGLDIDKFGYKLHLCKGSYFAYSKSSPVQRLVYPIPEKDLTGLGIHATLDLNHRLRFGPDTEYTDKLDYDVDINKQEQFYTRASLMIKGLVKENFHPDTAGVRPQIKGEGFKDFIITNEVEKGLNGFINLIGIESPGLTASLAIGKYVYNLVKLINN